MSPCHRAACRWWLLSLLCVAGGFLTKWTAPAFFYLTVVPLLWWRGRLRLLLGWPHLVGVAVAAGLGLAWIGAAVALTRWELFLETVSREGLMRLSPSHHHRPYPWHETLGRPFVILATGLPWSVFALVALRPSFAGRWDERGRRLLQALHCWAWPNLLFWTVLPGHAVRYTLPLFPAVSGLAALVWINWLRKQEGTEEGPRRVGLRAFVLRPSLFHILGMLAVWVVVKLVFVHAVMPLRNVTRQPRVKAAELASLVPPGVPLYLFNTKDEGIMFYYGRPVRRLRDVSQILSSGEPVYCILTEAEWQQWGPELPAEVLAHLRDEQRALIVLIRVGGTRP